MARAGTGPPGDPRGRLLRGHSTTAAWASTYAPLDGRGGIVAEASHLGVGATLAIPVPLGNGRYAFQCAFEETDIITGAATAVTGATGLSNRAPRPITSRTGATASATSTGSPGLPR